MSFFATVDAHTIFKKFCLKKTQRYEFSFSGDTLFIGNKTLKEFFRRLSFYKRIVKKINF